jgi:hypothetical protein
VTQAHLDKVAKQIRDDQKAFNPRATAFGNAIQGKKKDDEEAQNDRETAKVSRRSFTAWFMYVSRQNSKRSRRATRGRTCL